ncbi:MAG: hypothetical protein FJ160_02485 [Gammaproteobacteria bacterium]|nr:hypothetical protein [Gammaproteobacteria bacterium]
MTTYRLAVLALCSSCAFFVASTGHADAPATAPPATPVSTLVDNSTFLPSSRAQAAEPFVGSVRIAQSQMQAEPALKSALIDGRDASLFPALTLDLFSDGEALVPVQRGTMVRERVAASAAAAGRSAVSYWRVIPQFGRVWREPGDGGWSRAALPLILVNDTENHAHQGVAIFRYRGKRLSTLQFQFTQQTAPYLLHQHNIFWGGSALELAATMLKNIDTERRAARRELAERIPAKPWIELERQFSPGTLDGFGGPLLPRWQVINALVYRGTLYYQNSNTTRGPYPYPLEMRFGVRSVMKSIAAPLAMLRLAEVYGPYLFDLRIGDYVVGLNPKFSRVRFIDAANMATGFGGTGSFRTNPNNPYDGYLDADYDAWYTAGPTKEKLALISRNLKPYPWDPGTVMRYRDQDYFLLGLALDAFLKSVRGPTADLWEMLASEVFKPIGIHHAPAVRTRETAERDGLVWANAGYYPSLDDLAKIALLLQNGGAHRGQQILHRALTHELLAAKAALDPAGDASLGTIENPDALPLGVAPKELYRSGYWFVRHVDRGGKTRYLPSMQGSGENRVTLYPNGIITLQMGKAAELPTGEKALAEDIDATHRVIEHMLPFESTPQK